MNVETTELIRALGAVNQHIPRLVNDLLTEQMSAARQREYAELLTGLGELLHTHADIATKQNTRLILPPADTGRHALRDDTAPKPAAERGDRRPPGS